MNATNKERLVMKNTMYLPPINCHIFYLGDCNCSNGCSYIKNNCKCRPLDNYSDGPNPYCKIHGIKGQFRKLGKKDFGLSSVTVLQSENADQT